MEKADIHELLAQMGLPAFKLGADGYPLPGQVVKYYREKMTYTDPKDHKVRHWTQADLAAQLGLKEIMVNLMENKHRGLDSVDRRRTLATILRIPPALLGLGSFDQIVEIATGQNITATKQGNTKRARIGKDTIKLYQDTFDIYKRMYGEGMSYAIVHELEKWTKRIEEDTANVNAQDKDALLRIAWKYEILCAKMFSADIADWSKTFEHVDNAREIATTLADRDLQAASLCHAGTFHFRQGRLGLAKMDIDGALLYAKGALPQTKGIIYSKSACICADDVSSSGMTLVQNIFDEAEKYTDAKSELRTISFGKDDFYLDKSYVLLAFNRPAKALELINDAEIHINSSNKRHLVFLDILRAKCYITQKKPEYEQAVSLLESAIEDSKELRVARNIDHIEKLYTKLLASPYGNAPDVASLGSALQRLPR